MVRILIAYYSKTGVTKQMTRYVEEGCLKVPGTEVDVISVEDVTSEDLLKYGGIVLGSPVYYGTMAAPVKELIDRSVSQHGKLEGKVGGAFASGNGVGGGNETTVLDMLHALMIHGMVVKGSPDGDHFGPVAPKLAGGIDARVISGCKKYGESFAQLVKKMH